MIIRHAQEIKAESVTDAGAEKANVRWVIAGKDGAKNFFMRVFDIEPGGIPHYITTPGNTKCLFSRAKVV